MCVRERERGSESESVRERERVRVSVCVRERDREQERERERRALVARDLVVDELRVCVCERERERERERDSVCVFVLRESVRVGSHLSPAILLSMNLTICCSSAPYGFSSSCQKMDLSLNKWTDLVVNELIWE